MGSQRKQTFVHVCGALAPYTHRLFEAVPAAKDIDLHVLSCTDREPHRQSEVSVPKSYTFKTIPGRRHHASELSNIYFNPMVLRELWRLRPDAISVGGLSPTTLLAILYAIVTRTPWHLGVAGALANDHGSHSLVHRTVLQKLPAPILSGSMKALQATGAHNLFAPRYRGLGAIFMMHRVDPVEPPREAFAPHRHLSVTPDFLRRVIQLVRGLGYETISLDEVPERIASPSRRPFAVFTLDDGYRDNLRHAYPVFRAENVPFTIFVPSTWPDGRGELWWRAIEEVVARSEVVRPTIAGLPAAMSAHTVRDKYHAFDRIRSALVLLEEPAKYAHVRSLAERHGVDIEAICRSEIMSWTEIKELAKDPLVTIGAHTRTHAALSCLDAAALEKEIAGSRHEIEAVLGRPCRHFAFPYGAAEFAGPREFAAAARAGFMTAVTGRRGLLYGEHAQRLASLPRIALEGNLQDETLIEIQLSGVPFALRNGLRHQVA